MTHRISIHDFHADTKDTIALAHEHGLVEIYDDEGDCMLTVVAGAPLAGDVVLRDGREVLGRHLVFRDKWSYSCDGCRQKWQGAVTGDGFPRGDCPGCGGHFVYASRPLRTADRVSEDQP